MLKLKLIILQSRFRAEGNKSSHELNSCCSVVTGKSKTKTNCSSLNIYGITSSVSCSILFYSSVR